MCQIDLGGSNVAWGGGVSAQLKNTLQRKKANLGRHAHTQPEKGHSDTQFMKLLCPLPLVIVVTALHTCLAIDSCNHSDDDVDEVFPVHMV